MSERVETTVPLSGWLHGAVNSTHDAACPSLVIIARNTTVDDSNCFECATCFEPAAADVPKLHHFDLSSIRAVLHDEQQIMHIKSTTIMTGVNPEGEMKW